MESLDEEVCQIWQGSLEQARKSLHYHEKELARLEKKRDRVGNDITDARSKMNGAMIEIEELKEAGKDTRWIEDAPAFYGKNIERWENEIAEIDKDVVTIRGMIHHDAELVDLAMEKVIETC